jgi:hypothetical protein
VVYGYLFLIPQQKLKVPELHDDTDTCMKRITDLVLLQEVL